MDNFVSTDECTELFNSLKDLSVYKQEKGRSTIKFGEKYSYNGSREDSIVDFPPLVQQLLNKINEGDLVEGDVPPLNSCLVTKYKGPNSYIPEHSDNERAIHPGSSIVTVSLGHDTKVRFRDVHSGSIQEQDVKAGSIYAMTRSSQDLYKHSISKDQSLSESDIRISLTFRSLHWRNNNSTLIMGDSNTGGLKFANFGKDSPSTDHNGTFGNAMPGKRVAAFTIDQLDPLACIGYNNVIVHCGVNNIRGDKASTDEQVKEQYVAFKTKISDIITTNKRARVYVNTLLPTKSEDDNKKVNIFNSLIVEDLPKSFKDIRVINQHKRFSHVSGLLAQNISKEFNSHGEPDLLHLNAAGLRLLSSVIKNAVFMSKRSQERGTGEGSRVQRDGQSYSAVVSNRGRHGWRRAGSNSRSRRT